MTKFADIPWYILVTYLGTLETGIDPTEISYDAYSTDGNKMIMPTGTFVTRGVSQSLNLYAKNEDSDYKPLSFEIPLDWKQDNVIKLNQNLAYRVVNSESIKRVVEESGYRQITYDYLSGELEGRVEPGDYIYSRKDSELNQWVIDNWEDYGGELNPHLTFLYLGEGYTHDNDIEIHYYAMKDWVKDAIPSNNRNDNLDVFIDTAFDKAYNKVYNRQKNIINLIDPNEIEEDFFELMFNFYSEEPFVSLEEQYRIRLFLNNLIYLLKKRGTYSSLFIIWHILSEGTGNDLVVYDRWHDPTSETLPISALDNFDYTNYYKNGYDYPEIYALDEKILSTHYKVEFELNNNPFTDGYIINKNISNDLYNKWEELRPITRVSHYHELLYLDSDLSGSPISLYNNPRYDANLYSRSSIFTDVGEGNYVFNQISSDNTWEIQHDLNTKNLLIEAYELQGNMFVYKKPEKIEILGNNYVRIRFDDYITGTALLSKADYHQDTGPYWIIHYNLGSEQILYEAFDINDEKIVPKEAEILNSGNTLVLTFEEVIPGRCIIKDIQNTELKYVHSQTTYSNEWVVNHGLNYDTPIYEVYDENDFKIVPKSVYSTDSGTLYLQFDEEIRGTCLVYVDITYRHIQSTESDYWEITHGLETDDVFYELYSGDEEIIYPETFDIIDENNVLLTFSEPITGVCVLNKLASYEYERYNYVNHNLDQQWPISQYYYRSESENIEQINWVIDYNFSSENIIFEVYDDKNYIISPNNAQISNNGNRLTIYFDEITYGKCIIKDANQHSSKYVHDQNSANDTWTINHGLGTNELLYDVYDSNNYKIYPEKVTVTEDTMVLEFDRNITGRCIIINDVDHVYSIDEPSDYWVVNHNFESTNIFYQLYNGNGETIYPSESFAINLNTILMIFDEPISGKAVVNSKPTYTFYNYELRVGDSLVRYFPQENDDIEALNENRLDVNLNDFNESENYRVMVADVIEGASLDEPGYGHIHTQSVSSDIWTINHNLGTVGVILDVYDSNDMKVIPNDIHLLDQNTCEVYLDSAITGTCSVRAVGTPKSGPYINESFNGEFMVKFGYTEDEDHDYISDIANPIPEFTTYCDQTNVTEKENGVIIELQLPVGLEGYFNEIGIFNIDDNLIFYTTGEPVYKHSKINIDFKFTVHFSEL